MSDLFDLGDEERRWVIEVKVFCGCNEEHIWFVACQAEFASINAFCQLRRGGCYTLTVATQVVRWCMVQTLETVIMLSSLVVV